MIKYDLYVDDESGQAREGYVGTIQGKAAEIIAACSTSDEPFFVLRGKDIFSVMAIARYAKLLEDFSPDDFDMQQSVIDEVAAFKLWQRNNIELVRYPD